MNSIYYGTRNVLTVLNPDNKQEFAEHIVNTLLEIVAIQETRWSQSGLMKRNNYTFYTRGSSETGQTGNGFIVIKKALKYIVGFEPYNKQICPLRIKGKYKNHNTHECICNYRR